MAHAIACFQREGGYLAQFCTRVALHVAAGHAVGATGVPGALAPPRPLVQSACTQPQAEE